MGLDIYFHHVARKFEGEQTNYDDFRKFNDEVDKDAQETLRKKVDKLLQPLRKAWKDVQEYPDNVWSRADYNSEYFAFVEKLRPVIAKNYKWKLHPFTGKILELPELEELLNKEVADWYEQYDAYFRKVNFLFKYFEDRNKMVDQYYAFVEKEDVEDIIDKCKQILKDNMLAHELLPTQSGFFFGGTDYDEWYFYDVKNCLKQMKKYLKLFKNEGTGYVIFSW